VTRGGLLDLGDSPRPSWGIPLPDLLVSPAFAWQSPTLRVRPEEAAMKPVLTILSVALLLLGSGLAGAATVRRRRWRV